MTRDRVDGRRTIGLVRAMAVAGSVVAASLVAGPNLSAAHAAGGIAVTEVAPWGSGNSSYGVDWFEVTNSGASSIDVTGWKFDDNSNLFTSAVALNGITSIGPGESVIFLESATPAVTVPAFLAAWFGTTPPPALQVGTYTGSGVGLSTAGDAVNVYDATGSLRANVTFGASPAAAPFASFDNAAGIDGSLTVLSVAGVNGASLVPTSAPAPAAAAIGSPGAISGSGNGGGGTTTPTTPPTTLAPGTPWPGSATVTDASSFVFGGNLSGLVIEGSGGTTPGVLWGVRNGPGALFRMVWNGALWAPDTTNSWSAGKELRYPGGTGDVDAEGVTLTDTGAAGGVFVSAERNNLNNTVSRLSVLRYDVSRPGTPLSATTEWNLTGDLPTVGANLGLEAITWVPDSYLVANNFKDERINGPYVPASYAGHGNGLFFVGLEGNGTIYAYALDQVTGGFARIATIASSFPAVMDLQFDRDLNELWAVCDNTCNGQHALLRLDPATGAFGRVTTFDRPTGMANLNNEGFAIAPGTECVNDRKPVVWADDGETLGVSLRRGDVPCTAFVGPPPVVPEFPVAVLGAVFAAVVLLGALTVAGRRERDVLVA